jgi:hypothetical protein
MDGRQDLGVPAIKGEGRGSSDPLCTRREEEERPKCERWLMEGAGWPWAEVLQGVGAATGGAEKLLVVTRVNENCWESRRRDGGWRAARCTA